MSPPEQARSVLDEDIAASEQRWFDGNGDFLGARPNAFQRPGKGSRIGMVRVDVDPLDRSKQKCVQAFHALSK